MAYRATGSRSSSRVGNAAVGIARRKKMAKKPAGKSALAKRKPSPPGKVAGNQGRTISAQRNKGQRGAAKRSANARGRAPVTPTGSKPGGGSLAGSGLGERRPSSDGPFNGTPSTGWKAPSRRSQRY